MSEKKYSDEELKQMRHFEAFARLRGLKVGEPLMETQLEGIRFFIGDLIDKAEALQMTKLEVHFDKVGRAYTLHDEINIKQDGVS